jgi:hypothetical protein
MELNMLFPYSPEFALRFPYSPEFAFITENGKLKFTQKPAKKCP